MSTSAARDAADFAERHDLSEGGGLYRLLVESVQDYAIFALDPKGHILSWNAGAVYLKGYTAAEIIGKHYSTFYPPNAIAEGRPARLLEIAERDGRVEDEGWRVRKDGTRFWVDVVITALRDESGALVGFAKVTRDLTERRRANEALRQSEERFRLLVERVKEYAIFMLDPEGRIESWNEGAQRIKGYTAAEYIGRHFSTFYPAADIAAGKPAWELQVASRTGAYEEEGWRLRKDGTTFWANVLITAVSDGAGTLVGYAKVTRDLTERRAADERAIADARRIAAAEAASRTKSEFLAAMSHELRTPINATIGYTELFEVGIGGSVTADQREYLTRIRRSQEHLLRIITDLLNYSRIEAGHVHYELSTVSVQSMLDAVLPMIEPQVVRRRLELTGSCGAGILVWADQGKAQQILLNLLSNAVKFTPEGGRITVGCESRATRVLITVSDTGAGVPQEHREEIFEPFVQLGRSLTSGHEGTGLGLAISRDRARAMGGDLTVASVPESGAAFTLALPAR